jgi:LPS-assembly protein
LRGSVARGRVQSHAAMLCGATALGCALIPVTLPERAWAQDASVFGAAIQTRAPADSQMLLEADTLVYDNDTSTVTAVGGVRIDYGGYKLVAQRVSYDRSNGRLLASGGVQIVEPAGTKVFSDEIDITEDFADGFVNALRVETAEETYFAAESAERRDGLVTTFNNGVYTACAPCEDKPDQAPIWRIKAQKIIWNGRTKTVRFERSRFEFFGLSLFTLPAFEIADPTIRRKSGFLTPSVRFDSELGVGVSVPFYLALAPTYDLTLTGTGYTEQGFLGEAEWRQRFNTGSYSVKIAGIHQTDPGAFDDQNSVNSGPLGDPNKFRGMIGTKGNFAINPRWDFGWDVIAQTDKNFAHRYGIEGYSDYIQQSQVYLVGLNDRNYFDLRAMRFQVQENILDSDPLSTNDDQPWVLPTFDYSMTPDEPVAGGELNIDLNARSMYRSALSDRTYDNLLDQRTGVIPGIEGDSTRLTAEAEWRRSFVTDGGLVVTPLLQFQADGTYVNASPESVAAINAMANTPNTGIAADIRSAYHRFMATAGMEVRWPVLFSTSSGSHVLEPMAQIFARPDSAFADRFGIPNEDAQSFVFDASTLFERDKFSGYDLVEGGTRANVGLRYSGVYANGWTTNALFGQSYHLAGDNSFARADLVNAGAFSGLETDTSDYVALAGFAAPFGLAASVSGRFDEKSLELRRAEAKVGLSGRPVSLAGNYTFIQAQPLYGFSEDRHEVSLSASVRFMENWRAFGSGTYDLESAVLARDSLGFAYDDECFSYAISMRTTRDVDRIETDSRTFAFSVSLRTLGDFGSSRAGPDL